MTYKEAYLNGLKKLQENNIKEADLDARILMEFAANITRTQYFMKMFDKMDKDIYNIYMEYIERRSLHIPLQHITHEQEFMGFEFYVDENVLVPRQDTEVLVEEVLKIAKPQSKILDMCTGSGCIAISIKKLTESSSVCASDISEKAIQIARRNADNNKADIKIIHSDLFENINDKYDIIVSNPPYIPTKIIDTLSKEVKNHDPFMALDGKEDGLFFYRNIIKQSRNYLNNKGYLCFEIGFDQGKDVSQIMKENLFENIEIIKDLAGLDRVVIGSIYK